MLQLLYLVPSCLGSIALIALTRGDLDQVISFKDTPPAMSLLPGAKDDSSADQQ